MSNIGTVYAYRYFMRIPSIAEIFWALYIREYLDFLEYKFKFHTRMVVPNNNGCLIWPKGSRNGYGVLSDIYNNILYTHRISIMLRLKRILLRKDIVLHSPIICHNPLCYNTEHLTIGTDKDNSSDRRKDNTCPIGERNGMSKLTDEQIFKIFEWDKEGLSPGAIAFRLRVSTNHVSLILHGRRWNRITNIK